MTDWLWSTLGCAGQETIIVDALLVATGRSPNVAGLGLEAAGVQYSLKDGVKVSHNAVGPPCSCLKALPSCS